MTAFGVCKGLFLWGHQAQVTTGSCAQLRTVLPQENPVRTDMMITKHTRGALDVQAVPCVQIIRDLLVIRTILDLNLFFCAGVLAAIGLSAPIFPPSQPNKHQRAANELKRESVFRFNRADIPG